MFQSVGGFDLSVERLSFYMMSQVLYTLDSFFFIQRNGFFGKGVQSEYGGWLDVVIYKVL